MLGIGKFSSVDIAGELFARARKTKEGTFLEVLKWQESTSITHTRVRIPVDQTIVSHWHFLFRLNLHLVLFLGGSTYHPN